MEQLTAGYSDVIFGLFWLLGYRFSPRLADIGEARFWRIDPTANYGALDGLARNKINTDLIANNWDDMLRVAGSLKLGTVNASNLMRFLQRGNQQGYVTGYFNWYRFLPGGQNVENRSSSPSA